MDWAWKIFFLKISTFDLVVMECVEVVPGKEGAAVTGASKVQTSEEEGGLLGVVCFGHQ